jgi:DNA polymerase-3 subunit epsilon
VYLFFDTETTGIPRNWRAPMSDLDNWPRVVQIAWVVCDRDGSKVAEEGMLVKPVGFQIPADATRVHGITTDQAMRDGVSLADALARFSADAKSREMAIAHNLEFDENVLGAEFLRAGLSNPLPGMRRLCTMRTSTQHCRLPGRYGFKWPTLEELHECLFHEKPAGSHDALVDARACARCFFELRRLGVA